MRSSFGPSPAGTHPRDLVVRLLALLTLLLGCATTRGSLRDGWFHRPVTVRDDDGAHTVSVRWKVGRPGEGWRDAGDGTADFSYWHAGAGATMYGDTNCGDRFDDAPLTVLANHLFFGFKDVQTLSQDEATLGDRDALRRVATGKLDGRKVKVAATILKRGPCVFDMVYISTVERFDEVVGDYDRFVAGFDVRVER